MDISVIFGVDAVPQREKDYVYRLRHVVAGFCSYVWVPSWFARKFGKTKKRNVFTQLKAPKLVDSRQLGRTTGREQI